MVNTSACARRLESREPAVAIAQQAMLYKVSAVVRLGSQNLSAGVDVVCRRARASCCNTGIARAWANKRSEGAIGIAHEGMIQLVRVRVESCNYPPNG